MSWVIPLRPLHVFMAWRGDNSTSFEQNNWYIKQLHSARYPSSCCIFQHITKSTVTVILKMHNLHSQPSSCTQASVHIFTGHFAKIFPSYASVSLVLSSHDFLQPKFRLNVLFPRADSEVGSHIYYGGSILWGQLLILNPNIGLLCWLEKSGPEDQGLLLWLKGSFGLQMGAGWRSGRGLESKGNLWGKGSVSL